jgi:hypothetical protein
MVCVKGPVGYYTLYSEDVLKDREVGTFKVNKTGKCKVFRNVNKYVDSRYAEFYLTKSKKSGKELMWNFMIEKNGRFFSSQTNMQNISNENDREFYMLV